MKRAYPWILTAHWSPSFSGQTILVRPQRSLLAPCSVGLCEAFSFDLCYGPPYAAASQPRTTLHSIKLLTKWSLSISGVALPFSLAFADEALVALLYYRENNSTDGKYVNKCNWSLFFGVLVRYFLLHLKPLSRSDSSHDTPSPSQSTTLPLSVTTMTDRRIFSYGYNN